MCKSIAEGGRRCNGRHLTLDDHRNRAERRRERDRARKRAEREAKRERAADVPYSAATLRRARDMHAELAAETREWAASAGIPYDEEMVAQELSDRLTAAPEGSPEREAAKAALEIEKVIGWTPVHEQKLVRLEESIASPTVSEAHRQQCREELPRAREIFESHRAKYEALTGKPYVSVTVRANAIRELVDQDADVIAARAEWERQQATGEFPPVPREDVREVLRQITQRRYKTRSAAQRAFNRAVYAFENDDMEQLNTTQRKMYREGLEAEARRRAQERVRQVEAAARRRAEQALDADTAG